MNWVTALFVLGTASLAVGCLQTGEGKVTDTVSNVDTQGIVWKTTELYLTNDHDALYCINPRMKAQAESLAETRAKATIHYRTYFLYWPWECGSTGGYQVGGAVYKIEEKN